VNHKLVLGVLSGLAAVTLAVGGTTHSAFSDFGQVDGNVVGAGFLKLDLAVNGGADAGLAFGLVMPGTTTSQLIWAASDAGGSVPNAQLYLTFHDLADHAGPCDTSLGKAAGETDSGISGCTVAGRTATGTPAQGNLSRVLTVRVGYYPGVHNAAGCVAVSASEPRTAILPEAPGNLHASATANHGAGVRYRLSEPGGGAPLTVRPGAGVCIGIDATWPGNDRTRAEHPSRSSPNDNAAQGDSLTVDLRLDLVQAS
jgi:hypothetical protein